jgi:hypothetical protein
MAESAKNCWQMLKMLKSPTQGFTFSNTCKKCWNIIYDFTIIIKSAFFFLPAQFFWCLPPPPPFDGNLFYCMCVDRPREGGVGEGVRLSQRPWLDMFWKWGGGGSCNIRTASKL